MANWKKIIVSGSDAELNSLKVAGAVSASGFDGTGSYALQALTASYILGGATVSSASYASYAVSSSYAGNASTADSAKSADTASFVEVAKTASYVQGANVDGQVASALTASYALNVPAPTPSASWASSSISASYAGNASTADQAKSSFTASYVAGAGVDGSVASAFTASYVAGGNVKGQVASAETASYVALAQDSKTATSASHAVSADTASYIGTVSGPVVITKDLTVNGNFTVDGTASFQNTQNLNVADQFVLLSSGSAALQDSGLIVASGSNVGVAFYLETANTGDKGRWAVAGAVASSATSATADEYATTTKIQGGAPAVAPTFGGTATGQGNIYVDNVTGEIYIYS